MLKNTASQSMALFAFDLSTGAAKTGDAANMLYYVAKDWGAVSSVAANSAVPTEVDSTNAKGWYKIALSQGETNADALLFTGKSSTGSVAVSGQLVFTDPVNYTTFSVDGSGRVDVIKIAGTTQTARDIGASVLLSSGAGAGQLDFTSGVVKANATQIAGTTVDTTSPQLGVRVNNIVAAAVDTTSPQLGVRVVNIGASAVNSTSAQLGVNLVNIAGVAVNSASAQLGANVVTVASGAITSTAFTADAIGSTQLGATAVVKIADGMLDRDMSQGADSGTTTVRTVRQALRFLRNKWSISGGTLTICKEDDTATSWTAAVTTDSTALPIVTNDPAG